MNNNLNNNTQQVYVTEEENVIDVKGWLSRMLRIWPWFVLCLLFCMMSAWLYLRYAEQVFQAGATIIIKDDKKGGSSGLENSILEDIGIGGQGKLLENEVEVLKSIDLMELVVRKQSLYLDIRNRGKVADRTVFYQDFPYLFEFENPDSIAQVHHWYAEITKSGLLVKMSDGQPAKLMQTGQAYQVGELKFLLLPNPLFKAGMMTNMLKKPNYELIISPIAVAAKEFSSELVISPVGKMASVLSLTIKDKHPQRAETVLKTLILLYNQQGLEDKNMVTSNTIDFLNERLKVVEAELKGVENMVAGFKQSNQITNISGEAEAYLEMAKTIDHQKAEQQTRLNLVQALENELLANQNNPKLVPSTFGIADASLASLIERHNQLIQQRERMAERAGYKNPALIDLENQVLELRASMLSNVGSLKNAYTISLSDVSLQDRLLNNRLSTIPVLERDLVQISRDRNVQEQLYLFLLQKREESAVTLAGSISDSRTIARPRSAGMVSPRVNFAYGLAFILGLLIPVLIVVGIDFLDNNIGSRDEVEKSVSVPLLGEISFVKKMDSPIVIQSNSRSVVAEQFRALRTNISFTRPGSLVKTILVTSHRPGEGKSFTSLNLAASYALLNKKVVILEFDLRKPRLMRNLGLKSEWGISTFLSGKGSLDEMLVELGEYNGNFWLLPTGPVPPNPAELILGGRMNELMTELSSRFDYIIIDSPPFSVVTDATLLQQYTDINVVVLRQGYSFKDAYTDINNRVTQFGEKPHYAVLNGVGKTLKYSYYGAKYGSKNGYGYGYGYADEGNTDASQNLRWFKAGKSKIKEIS